MRKDGSGFGVSIAPKNVLQQYVLRFRSELESRKNNPTFDLIFDLKKNTFCLKHLKIYIMAIPDKTCMTVKKNK